MQVASTKLLALGAALVLVAGCSRAVQTTAGEDYLSFYTEADTIGTSKAGDPVREIASIEPLLQFPARIGVARVELGDLVPVPRAEAVAWAEAAERLGPTFGTFVPLNALAAEMAAPVPPPARRAERLRTVVDEIRLGAARQGLDAVLIYETRFVADTTGNPLSFADWIGVGAILLPGRSIDATAFGSALLIDVRNGYPYGTVDTAVDRQTMATARAAPSVARDTGDAAREAAALLLIEDVERMMLDLMLETTGLAEFDSDWAE